MSRKRLLPDDARIDERHENGTPSRATLGATAIVSEVHGWTLLEGDELALREDGSITHALLVRPRVFADRDRVQFVVFDESERPTDITAGEATFDAEGSLLRRKLMSPEVIDGFPCAGFASFHPNGRLRNTTLAEPLETPHGVVPAGSVVTLANDGALISAMVSDTCVLGGRTFPARNSVQFTASGPIEGGWTFYTTPPGPPDPPF